MGNNKVETKQTHKKSALEVINILLLLFCSLIFVGLLVCSIVFELCCNCEVLNENSIGVVCQVVTAIAACLASIIAISISLQNDECFGIPVKKFNNLRVGFHFSISKIISTKSIIFPSPTLAEL